MNKLNLNNVTLLCLDDINTKKSAEVLEGVSHYINFGAVKLFSSKAAPYVSDKIEPINSIPDYNKFFINELYKHIDTEFIMTVQTDGYPINFSAWTEEFLEYDYIGAPWTWVPSELRLKACEAGSCVGNGGFSLRSRKIMEAASNLNYEERNEKFLEGPVNDREKEAGLEEDVFLCRVVGEELKSMGFKFAPCELAAFFSVENNLYNSQFGFHGRSTLKINQEFGIFGFKDHAYESIH